VKVCENLKPLTSWTSYGENLVKSKCLILLWVLLPIMTLHAQEATPDVSPIDFVVVFDYSGELYTTNFVDEPTNITNSEAHEVMPLWSADGSEIAFLASSDYAAGGCLSSICADAGNR
jgi:hypothetical protein